MQTIRHQQQTYQESIEEQESIVGRILTDNTEPTMILTEHPPLFSIGTSGSQQDILTRNIDGEDIGVFESGRGGEVTYHGPGQLVCYVMDDLRQKQDLHKHVWRLEEMVIRTLADFNIQAARNERGIGVWVNEKKIAAVGVRCRKWITFHGIALNINPNLEHYSGIVACGMSDNPVTSMNELGITAKRCNVETALCHHSSIFS